jgi:hypothetical protein
LAHVRAARGAERAAAAQTLRAAEEAAQPLRERRQQTDADLASAKRRLAVAERTRDKFHAAIDGKSGANYFSNVSILQEMNLIEDATLEVSVYIEGIGTDDGEEDDSIGFGFGAGATGVPVKVSKGILQLKEQVTEALRTSESQLGTLHVDAFGFSRGAVAARHFVARTTAAFFPKHVTLCQELNLAPDKLTVNFVGLFDSVSSYGGERAMPAQVYHNLFKRSFNDDVTELRLNLEDVPAHVVHFTAADEYRKNFASTTIDSTLPTGKGTEVALPGVHSDIGGGYEERALETRNVPAAYRQRLLDDGWYAEGELTGSVLGGYVGRRVLTHHYQFVALRMMLELAQQGGLTFRSFVDEFESYKVPTDLAAVHAALWKQVQDAVGQTQRVLVALPEEHQWVRRQYMHRSALKHMYTMSGIAMKGRETKDGFPNREIISDLG